MGLAGKQALQRRNRSVLKVAMESEKNANYPTPPPTPGPVIEPEMPSGGPEAQGGE